MSREIAELLLVTGASLLNIMLTFYISNKRVPSEIEKIKAEKAESYSEVAESNMEGARISNELLLARINELKKEKRDMWNYIAILRKQMIEAELEPAQFVPSESDPKNVKPNENTAKNS